jgi:hypothetical protein
MFGFELSIFGFHHLIRLKALLLNLIFLLPFEVVLSIERLMMFFIRNFSLIIHLDLLVNQAHFDIIELFAVKYLTMPSIHLTQK